MVLFSHNGEQGRNTTCLASFGFFPFYIDTLFPLSRFHSFQLISRILNILLAILTPFRMSFTAAIYSRVNLHSLIHRYSGAFGACNFDLYSLLVLLYIILEVAAIIAGSLSRSKWINTCSARYSNRHMECSRPSSLRHEPANDRSLRADALS